VSGTEGETRALPKTVFSVQYLRAAAAISVVIFHCGDHAHISGDWPVKVLASGVDVFFPISGFIMWVTTFGGGVGPRKFLSRRIKRIVPLYWIITAIAVFLALISTHFGGRTNFTDSLTSFFFLPAQNPATHNIEPIVSPGWTLSYEMLFYAFFTISLVLPSKRSRLVMLGACLGALALLGTLVNGSTAWTFYSDPIILEFAFGVAAGFAYTSGATITHPRALVLGVLAVAAMFVLDALAPHVNRAFIWGTPGAVLVAAAALAEARQGWRFHRLPILLGDASYAIYISQGLFLSALALVLKHAHIPPWTVMLIGPPVTVVGGVLIHLYVEKPISARLRRRAIPNVDTIDSPETKLTLQSQSTTLPPATP
jgi:exopolysaccharide production protein ExoZ